MSWRAVSPVVGSVLSLAIVLLLAVVVGSLALGLDDELQDPGSKTTFEAECAPHGTGNGGTPYLDVHFASGDVADGTEVYVRDGSGHAVRWADAWTAGPRVGRGSYVRIDGCGSDGALDTITESGQEYYVVFDDGRGNTRSMRTLVVPSDPTTTGC